MRNKNAKVSDPHEFYTCAGSQFKIEYSARVLPDGRIELQPSGKVDIKAMINSQAELTDINYIIKQIENGNYDVINPQPAFYADTTQFPQTLAEAMQLRIDAEKSFYQLSPDVRKKFDNDVNQYFASAGSDIWLEKLGYSKEEVAEDFSTNKEVKTDES